MENSLKELIGLLSVGHKEEVRIGAIDLLTGLTVGKDEKKKVCEQGSVLVDALITCLKDKNETLAIKSQTALVNLTSEEEIVVLLMKSSIVQVLNDIVEGLPKSSERFPLIIALLCNLSRHGDHSPEIVKSESLLKRLFEEYMNDPIDKSGEKSLEHFPSLMMNLAQNEDGRNYLKANKEKLIPILITLFQSPNKIKRHGAVGAIRNYLLLTDEHDWMILNMSIVSSLQLLLVGPEIMDDEDKDGMLSHVAKLVGKKERESEVSIRKLILEAFIILSSTTKGRIELVKQKTYPIVRNADKVETDETANELAYDLVNILINEEETMNGKNN